MSAKNLSFACTVPTEEIDNYRNIEIECDMGGISIITDDIEGKTSQITVTWRTFDAIMDIVQTFYFMRANYTRKGSYAQQ